MNKQDRYQRGWEKLKEVDGEAGYDWLTLAPEEYRTDERDDSKNHRRELETKVPRHLRHLPKTHLPYFPNLNKKTIMSENGQHNLHLKAILPI